MRLAPARCPCDRPGRWPPARRSVIAVPVVTAPQFPDFVAPTVPADSPAARPSRDQDRGWRFLQAGDLKNAEREVAAALKAAPDFYPAEATVGYVELARKDRGGAAALRSGARAPGRLRSRRWSAGGRRWSALEREAEAVAAFEAALAVDPSLTDLAAADRGAEVPRRSSRTLARARRRRAPASSTKRVRAYRAAIASSPDSAFLYRELAALERQTGRRRTRRSSTPQGSRARSGRRRVAGQIGDILLERAATSSRALKAYDGRAGASSRTPTSRRSGTRAAAPSSRGCRRNTARSDGAADHARRSGGADRRPARPSLLAGDAAARRRRHHRHAQALGRDLDHRGHARRRHGAVRQPHLPAADLVRRVDLAQAISRGCSSQVAVVAPAQATALGRTRAAGFRICRRPPRVSRRIGGGRRRGHDDRRRRRASSRRS